MASAYDKIRERNRLKKSRVKPGSGNIIDMGGDFLDPVMGPVAPVRGSKARSAEYRNDWGSGRSMGDRNRAGNRELQRRKAGRRPRNATGYHGLMAQYNEDEFNRLKAMYDQGIRFAPGSPEDQKLVNWANIDAYRAKSNEPGVGAQEPPPPPTPPTPQQPSQPSLPGGPSDTMPMPGEEVGYVDDPSLPGNQPMPGQLPGETQPMPAPPEQQNEPFNLQNFMGQFQGQSPEAYQAPAMPSPPPPPSTIPQPVQNAMGGASVASAAPSPMGLNTAATMPPPQPQSSPMAMATTGGGNQQHSIDINIKDDTEQAGASMIPPMTTTAMPPPPQQMAGPYPQPAPPTNPPPSPYAPWGQAPANPPPATPPQAPAPPAPAPGMGGSGRIPGPVIPEGGGHFGAPNFDEDNYYGPQQIAGTRPDNADYDSVRDFSDAAHENARRYLDPQQDTENRRFDQELINKGIDPLSPQGQEMAAMLGRQQADANNAAAFGAMGFGQGIQNQMAQQAFQRSGLAGDMQKALWNAQLGSSGQNLQKYLGDQQSQIAKAGMQNDYNLGRAGIDLQRQLGLGSQNLQRSGQDLQRYGMDQQFELGKSGQDLQRYGMDQGFQLGQGQLDLSRQGQDFNQMMGLEGINFRDRQYNDQQGMYQDQLLLSLLGANPYGQGNQIDPSGFANMLMQQSGNSKGIFGTLFGG